MNQRKLLRHVRLACWLLAGLLVFHLFQRYDTYELPDAGCSPLLRFAPGDTLLLDRSPPGYHRDDAVLFAAGDGLLYLGVVTRTRPDGAGPGDVRGLWVETDAPECPGKDSDELGWISVEDVGARVVLVWPW